MSTCFDRVDDWPAECRAELFEQIDTVFHSGAISLVECGEPLLEQIRADDGPRHWFNIGQFLYRRNPMFLAAGMRRVFVALARSM